MLFFAPVLLGFAHAVAAAQAIAAFHRHAVASAERSAAPLPLVDVVHAVARQNVTSADISAAPLQQRTDTGPVRSRLVPSAGRPAASLKRLYRSRLGNARGIVSAGRPAAPLQRARVEPGRGGPAFHPRRGPRLRCSMSPSSCLPCQAAFHLRSDPQLHCSTPAATVNLTVLTLHPQRGLRLHCSEGQFRIDFDPIDQFHPRGVRGSIAVSPALDLTAITARIARPRVFPRLWCIILTLRHAIALDDPIHEETCGPIEASGIRISRPTARLSHPQGDLRLHCSVTVLLSCGVTAMSHPQGDLRLCCSRRWLEGREASADTASGRQPATASLRRRTDLRWPSVLCTDELVAFFKPIDVTEILLASSAMVSAEALHLNGGADARLAHDTATRCRSSSCLSMRMVGLSAGSHASSGSANCIL